ncbi:MAG: hypothetical protein AAF203_06735 [Pseudomonadota bacterium]
MKISKYLIPLLGLFLLTHCGSNEDSPVEVAGSTIGTLPANTDPVIDVSSSSVTQKAIEALAAVTGLPLRSWADTNNWQSSNSRAMCEVGQALKEALSEAMNPDKIKCYVGAVHSSGAMGSVTIDDGSDVYFQLTNFPENPNMQPRIKMRITKNAAGLINRFEMWSCFDHNGSNYVQSEYILQTINDDLSVSSFTKHTGSYGSETYGGTSTVSGQLNSSYQWISKSMQLQRYYGGTGFSHSQDLNVTQRSGSYVVSGYNAGSWGQDIFSNAFYAAVQGLNMASPKDIALGDGSANYNFDWCFDSDSDSDCSDESGGNRHTGSSIDSWNGDTRQNLGTASDGDYHSEVNSASVPSVSSVSAISFSGDEIWDCQPASAFVDADMSNMEDTSTPLGQAFAACDGKYDYQEEGSGYACDAAQ